ncbi:protein of unknown function [Tepidibacter aestuarii]|nr:protein of unknown function [Tepidibacter aestuarii]
MGMIDRTDCSINCKYKKWTSYACTTNGAHPKKNAFYIKK